MREINSLLSEEVEEEVVGLLRICWKMEWAGVWVGFSEGGNSEGMELVFVPVLVWLWLLAGCNSVCCE